MGGAHQAVLCLELHAGLHEAPLVVVGLDAAKAFGVDLVDRDMKVKVACVDMRGRQPLMTAKSDPLDQDPLDVFELGERGPLAGRKRKSRGGRCDRLWRACSWPGSRGSPSAPAPHPSKRSSRSGHSRPGSFPPQGCNPPCAPSRPAPPRRRRRGCSGRGGGSSRRRARAQFAWRSWPHPPLPRSQILGICFAGALGSGSFDRPEEEAGFGLGSSRAIMAVSSNRCHGFWPIRWRSSWSSSRSCCGDLLQPLRQVGIASPAHDGLDIADKVLGLFQEARRRNQLLRVGLHGGCT